MARGTLPPSALARQSKQARVDVRAACLARIKELLTTGPMSAGDLVAQLLVTRSTAFGYIRFMHKMDRTIRTVAGTEGRAALWTLGEDPTLPDIDQVIDGEVRRMVPARQIGVARHWMDVALFGPAQVAA